MERLLKDFIFENFEDAMEVHSEIFKIMRDQGYVTYADFFRLMRIDQNEELPEFYYKRGWTNLMECQVRPYNDTKKWALYMPPIKNIENYIKMKEKENKNEGSNN